MISSRRPSLHAILRLRSLVVLWTVLFMTAATARAQSFEVHFADKAFDATSAARSFARDIEFRLPTELKKYLSPGLRIHLIGQEADQVIPSCQAKNGDENRAKLALGHTKRSFSRSPLAPFDFDINAGFKRQIELGPARSATFSCSHRSGYRLALAVALHEAAHLYSYQDISSPTQQDDIRRCENERALSGVSDAPCTYVLAHAPSIVSDLRFLSLLWFSPWNLSAKSENTWLSRLPDQYETTEPAEAFAVNFEYFLLDPEYRCRRPLESDYFAQRLNHQPKFDSSCSASKNVEVFSVSSDLREEFRRPQLDLTRLYAIDFLLADRGEDIRSKWGHAMFRLVFCAPGRALSSACRKDTAYHLVITFRAKIEENSVDLMKGVAGGYPSMMFIQPMTEIIHEYTHDQFRDLRSLPLKLSRAEQSRFLLRTLELYWSYRGRYLYFTNNCATEAIKLLNVARGDAGVQRRFIASPIDLYETLAREGLIDPTLLAKRSQAMEASYFVPSYFEQLNNYYRLLQTRWPRSFSRWADVKEYFHSTPSERAAILTDLVARGGLATKQEALAIAILEKNLFARAERKLVALLADEVLGESPSDQSKELRDQSPLGYGIPLPGDFIGPEATQPKTLEEKELAQQALVDKLLILAKVKRPREYKEFMESKQLFSELDRNLIERLGGH